MLAPSFRFSQTIAAVLKTMVSYCTYIEFFWLAQLNKQNTFVCCLLLAPQFKAETLSQSAEGFSLKEIRERERKTTDTFINTRNKSLYFIIVSHVLLD